MQVRHRISAVPRATAGDLLRFNGTTWVSVKPTLLIVVYVMREDPTSAVANFTWTNMPNATNPLYGASATSYVRRLDLTYASQARFSFSVATGGAAGAKLFLRYSTDGSTFSTPTPNIEAVFGTGTGPFTSGWTNLDASMKGDVWVGVYGNNGDGTADPRFTTIAAEFR